MYNLTKEEEKVLRSLNSPGKIQDFLNNLKINFELKGETCMSPRMVLKTGMCHCIEGAMLAALALRFLGYKPLLVDLTATKDDFDHVIAVYKKNEFWGAISHTNHGVLRYREPIYKNIRELVMSYFHEYTDPKGRKTLRSYSNPVDLSKFDKKAWMTSEKDLWYINDYLEKVKHYPIINKKQIRSLRKQDDIEMKAGSIVKEKKKGNLI